MPPRTCLSLHPSRRANCENEDAHARTVHCIAYLSTVFIGQPALGIPVTRSLLPRCVFVRQAPREDLHRVSVDASYNMRALFCFDVCASETRMQTLARVRVLCVPFKIFHSAYSALRGCLQETSRKSCAPIRLANAMPSAGVTCRCACKSALLPEKVKNTM